MRTSTGSRRSSRRRTLECKEKAVKPGRCRPVRCRPISLLAAVDPANFGAVADATGGRSSRKTFGERVIYDNQWVWLGQVDGERFWHHVVRRANHRRSARLQED